MEEKRLVTISSYSCAKSYVLSLNESQVRLLEFLSDEDIIDTADFTWSASVSTNGIIEV